MLTRLHPSSNLALRLVAANLSPVSCGPIAPDTTGLAFAGPQTLQPSHTFTTCPALDVLLVPGGPGALTPTPSGQAADTDAALDFIRMRFDSLKYLITVCTGAGIAAQAGVLDGKMATANKRRWHQVVALGPRTHWVANARWVVDGKLWTTSGVSAGIDGVVAWIARVFGDTVADQVCLGMEYVRRMDSADDPFAGINGVEDVLPML